MEVGLPFCSALLPYAKTKEVDIAQKLGAGKYIRKPYTLEEIGIAVKKELKE